MIDRRAALSALVLSLSGLLASAAEVKPPEATPDLEIRDAQVEYLADLDLLVFEQRVAGTAGGTTPAARGRQHGAPVLGYVFPTTLRSEDVGFRAEPGIVALAATSHPDFDDTPLWDENGDRDYGNDGVVFHSHWVLLVEDDRVPGGLAVRELPEAEIGAALPPTSPGMPLFLDSPGFSVLRRGDSIRVLVPAARAAGRRDFRFDAVTAYLEVNTEDEGRPMLGVYAVYGVRSGDLSLPYAVTER